MTDTPTVWDLVKRVMNVLQRNPDMAKLDSLLLQDYKRHLLTEVKPTKPELRAAKRWKIIEGDDND
jgi:hypothetical protein